MEDFREIVGFLIIGIGILLSVLKERKGKNSSGSSNPAQNTPIQRRPQNQPPVQQRPAQYQPAQQRPMAKPRQQASEATTSLPFVLSSVAERAGQQQSQPAISKSASNAPEAPKTHTSQTNPYQSLPEEGTRVTKDDAPMEPISDYNAQEEEEFIEKLREGIILSEILQRKF